MGDDDGGAAGQGGFERALDGGFGFGIEMGGGLVENDNVRRLEEQTGDSKALLLAAGEAVAALADHGFELVGETLYEIQDLRVAKSGADLVVGGVGPGIEQVGADGVVEEMGILGDDADTLVDRVELQVADIDAADADGAALRVVEARDEVGDGGFAGAGGSDQRDQLAGSECGN